MEKCQNCNGVAEPLHPCPFKDEVDNDDKTLCNCCQKCTQQCEDDI